MIELPRMTMEEIEYAATKGLQRQIVAIDRNYRHYFEPIWEWDNQIEGTLAEYAVALFYNVPWDGTVGRIDTADVGPLQVRWVRRGDGYLPIRPPKNPHPGWEDEWYVMVQGKNGRYQMVGVIHCREGQRLGPWKRDHWAVGQHLLKEPPLRLVDFPGVTSVRA